MEKAWDTIKRALVQLTHFQKRNRIKRYGIPIFLVILIFFIKHYFHPILGDNSAFLLVSFIVAVSSWYGGIGSGVFATALSLSLIYFLYLSNDRAYHPFIGDLVLLAVFTIEGIIISIVSEARYEVENQKDDFISFVSHELKNPLATIKGFAQLVIHSSKKNKYERVEEFAAEINNQSDRILELINDLLDITKIEIGKFTYQNDIFNFDELVKEVITHQKIIFPNRNIKMVGRTNNVIFADKYRIRQVIVNLLTNALKYSPETKGVILRLRSKKESILMGVRDYGIGIAKDEQARIFDRYYRTKSVQRKRSEGLGLGLYITNQIVKHHRGKIWVESRMGKGSTFFINLPVNSQQLKINKSV